MFGRLCWGSLFKRVAFESLPELFLDGFLFVEELRVKLRKLVCGSSSWIFKETTDRHLMIRFIILFFRLAVRGIRRMNLIDLIVPKMLFEVLFRRMPLNNLKFSENIFWVILGIFRRSINESCALVIFKNEAICSFMPFDRDLPVLIIAIRVGWWTLIGVLRAHQK